MNELTTTTTITNKLILKINCNRLNSIIVCITAYISWTDLGNRADKSDDIQ